MHQGLTHLSDRVSSSGHSPASAPHASSCVSGQAAGGRPVLPSGSDCLPSSTAEGRVVSSATTSSALPLTINLSSLLPAVFASLPLTVSQSINSSSVSAAVSQSQCLSLSPKPVASTVDENANPFFLRFIGGNIRVCQGCRSSLRTIDGGIPQAPFDLAIARFERRPYRDKNGELKTPSREQTAHYHLKIACVQAASPYFMPSSLVVPTDVLSLLSVTHKEYLRLMFGISL